MAKGITEELDFIFKCFDGFLEGFVQQKKWFLQEDKTSISSLSDLLDGILEKCPKTLKNKVKSNGPGPFEQWETQIGNSSNQETQRCFKYIVWLWNLPDSETNSPTKNKCVDNVIEKYCFPKDMKWGIGGASPRSQKPQEIKYLVLLLQRLSNTTYESIDCIKKEIISCVINNTIIDESIGNNVPIKNALLYMCAPEKYEPIFSNGNKGSIVKAFPELSIDKDIDKALKQIREALMLCDNEGFYRDDIYAIWSSDGKEANEKLKKKNDLLNNIKMKRYKSLLEKSHNLILTGAPGTGKTYLAKKIAKEMTDDKDNNLTHFEMVQFHPSYDYSDFVEGLRPVKDATGNMGFERKDGVFKEFCKKALANSSKTYVFIIDEINRGEMSKIFGELFFSIDPGYRGTKGRIKTQYQNLVDKEYDENGNIKGDDVFKDGFFVPENVYIIGTMNDIDRSVESMDFAMRRRFAFKEITADERIDMWADAKLQDVNDEIKNHMQCLNYAIQLIPGLSSAYHVGPSYFLSLPNTLTDDDFKALWNSRLKGLLFEYLRGMPNAEVFLDKLEEVYNNATCLDDSKKQDIENKMKA